MKKTKSPIIFLTAKGQEYDKTIGFSAGTDDFIVKPFVPSELTLRVNANLRRYLQYGGGASGEKQDSMIRIGDLCINQDSSKVTVSGTEQNLTATEYRILHLMCQHKGKVFSAQNIYESIWNGLHERFIKHLLLFVNMSDIRSEKKIICCCIPRKHENHPWKE